MRLKKIAEDYLKIYQPLSIQVLDCISNTVIRAFHYFIDYKIEKNHCFFIKMKSMYLLLILIQIKSKLYIKQRFHLPLCMRNFVNAIHLIVIKFIIILR